MMVASVLAFLSFGVVTGSRVNVPPLSIDAGVNREGEVGSASDPTSSTSALVTDAGQARRP